MGYNKRQFTKANDKKVLHKVRKHWVVISMALLMAIGGKAAASHVSAHADTTNNADLTNRISNNINQSKSTLTKASTANTNNASQAKAGANQTSNISNQASALHQRILQNANLNNNSNNNNQKSVQAPKVNNAQVNASASKSNPLSSIKNVAGTKVNNSISSVQKNNQVDLNNNQKQNKQATTMTMAPADEPEVGSGMDKESVYTRTYLDASNHNQDLGSENDAASDGTPLTTFLNNWKKDVPEGYELDPTATADASDGGEANTTDGVILDNNAGTTAGNLSTFEKGQHFLNIYVKKIPPKASGTFAIQYKNMSDNNSVLAGGKTYSNFSSDKMSANNFNEDTHAVPAGYTFGQILDNGGTSFNFNAQGNAQSDAYYPNGTTQTVVVGVHPISTSANTETVNYLDQSDGNNVVDSRLINGKKGHNVDVSGDIDKYVPNGYDYVSNDFNGTPSFTKNGTLNVEVHPNGVAPVSPSAPSGQGYINVNYISDGGTNVLTKTFMNNLGHGFTASSYSLGSQLPTGYSYNNSGTYNIYSDDNNGNPQGGTNTVNQFTSKPQSIDIDVTKNSGYTPAKATAYIQYTNIKDGSPIGSALTIDAGATTHEGDPINYNQYINFVPKDTTFAGMGAHDSVIVNGHTNIIYLKKANTSSVAPITVQYYNQHGDNISHANITDVNYGSNINVTDYRDKSNTEHHTVPSGYTVNSGENTMCRADSDAHTVNVLVTGKNENSSFKLVPVEHQAGHEPQKQPAKIVNISGRVGDSQTINLNSNTYKPSGYVVDPTDNASVIVEPNGKVAQQNGESAPVVPSGDAGNQEIDENYNQVAPVTVNYINQNGDNVGHESIYANDGSTVDVTKNYGRNAPGIPTGYDPVSNQTTNYKVTTNPLNLNFLVKGKKVTVNYTVHRNKFDPYGGGQTGTFNDVHVSQASDQVGNSIDVNPDAKKFKPAGYNQASGHEVSNKSYKINYNAADGTGSLDGAPFTFDYSTTDPNVSNPKSISVVYEDQAGNKTAPHQLTTGGYGDSVTVDDPATGGYLPSNVSPASAGNSFSTPYEIDKNQPSDMIASFGDVDQTVTVHVHGHQENTTYNVKPIYNKDGHSTAGAVVNRSYSGEVGDHITVNPQDFNTQKNNYEPTYQDATGYLTVKSDGTTTPNPLEENYNVKQSTIHVQYQDVNNSNHVINSDSILGNDTDPFDETKYTSGNGVPSGYVLDGTPAKITNFTSDDQTLDIPVQQWDHTTIQYVNGADTVDQENFSGTPSTMVPLSSRYSKQPPTGYDVTGGPYYDTPILAHNNGTITINVTPNSDHPNVPSDSKRGWITVNYISSTAPHSGYTKKDIANSITFVGDQGSSWDGGTTINGTNILNAVPAGTTSAGLDYDDGTTSTVQGSGFQAGQHEVMTVMFNGTPSRNNVSDYILYKSTADGSKVGSDEINGIQGDPIDYSPFEKYVPQDFSYDKYHTTENENTIQPHTDANTPNVIWVTPEVPDVTYGAVKLQYVAQGGPDNGTVISSDTEIGKTGDLFDPAKDEADVPSHNGINYQYAGNDGMPIKRYGTASYSNPQVMRVYVTPNTIKPFNNYTINYYAGGVKKASITANGNYKSDFSISDYMNELPSNISGQYIATDSHLDGKGSGSTPTIFDGHDETIDVDMNPVSD